MFNAGNPQRVINGAYPDGRLTAPRRILAHLVRYQKLRQNDGFNAPSALSQDGIAMHCELTRAHAAVALSSLRKRGWVEWELMHVDGKSRKVRVFTVTPTAMAEVFNRDVQL